MFYLQIMLYMSIICNHKSMIIDYHCGMEMEILTALIAFGFIASVTPGPNNLMLMSSGANFGIRRTLPHLLGISVGFVVMVVLVGIGLLQLLEHYPLGLVLLRWVSIAYLSFLAWKIATTSSISSGSGAKPLTSLQAALFQWVNPKAWAFALSALTVYAPSQNLAAIALVALVLGLVNLPSIFVWVVLGERMHRFLQSPARLKMFNYGMAMMLMLTLYPILSGTT